MIKLDCYVYALLDPRKPGRFRYGRWVFRFEPFYVGKGKGNRCHTHIKSAMSGKTHTHKDRKIRKILKEGLEVVVRYLKRDLSSLDAGALEMELISKVGRSDLKKGPLTNLTDGGEGVVGASKKLREFRRNVHLGKTKSEEHRRKISEALKGRQKAPETIEKLREAQKKIVHRSGWSHSEETRRKMSEAKRGRKQGPMSDETKQKIGKALKGIPKSPEHVIKASTARKRSMSGHTG